jgi:membrane protease YdiL (CAAX protease family)
MKPLAKQIVTFICLVFLFSSLPYFLMIHTHHVMTGNGLVVRMIMWCPTAAALATCALFRIDTRTLGWNWRPLRYEALGYYLPLLYAIPVYAATWIAVPGSFALGAFEKAAATSFSMPSSPHVSAFGLMIPMLATLGVIGSLANALGEEIGWRGFLLPRLVGQFGFTFGCVVSGLIWGVWHYPGLLWADYNAGTNPKYALACFTCMVVAMSFVMGWLRLKSGSLWPCAMLHASHNLFIQAVFDEMTAPAGRALYITTEFGCGLVLTISAAAVYFWSRRRELDSSMEIALEQMVSPGSMVS